MSTDIYMLISNLHNMQAKKYFLFYSLIKRQTKREKKIVDYKLVTRFLCQFFFNHWILFLKHDFPFILISKTTLEIKSRHPLCTLAANKQKHWKQRSDWPFVFIIKNRQNLQILKEKS